MESYNKCRVNSGFTLVELSIVMIIIGLLIGGIFGGMKLIDNANVQKTVQDIKSIESAALTFKDTYRGIPGDLRNASSRLPNCTASPCSTVNADMGNRQLDSSLGWHDAIAITNERFIFWHHLQAASLLSMEYHNVDDLNFGDGQPNAPNAGYRIGFWSGGSFFWPSPYENMIDKSIVVINTGAISNDMWSPGTQDRTASNCSFGRAVDVKIDDGMPMNGKYMTDRSACTSTSNPTITNTWAGLSGRDYFVYLIKI